MSQHQKLLFTAEMCFGMGTIMSLLGDLLGTGLTGNSLRSFMIWWLPTVAFAFFYNLFVAGKITDQVISYTTAELTTDQAIEKRSDQIRSWLMILIMCFSMSTLGLLTSGKLFSLPLSVLTFTWIRSLFLAYLIRGILVKPLALKGLQISKLN